MIAHAGQNKLIKQVEQSLQKNHYMNNEKNQFEPKARGN